MFTMIDNLGSPMIPHDNKYLWIGNLGSIIDIRDNIGSIGYPIIIVDSLGNTITIENYIKTINRNNLINSILDEQDYN